MRSKTIKIINIPEYPYIIRTVSVKPIALMFTVIGIGVSFLFINTDFAMFGLVFIIIAIFSIMFLPDAKIVEYTDEYIILYNTKEKDECKLVYWDEILGWQYKWHTDKDELNIELIDHSIEKVDIYSKSTVFPYFKKYASGKERKNDKRRRNQ